MPLIRLPNRDWQELDGMQDPFSIKTFHGVWTNNPMAATPGYAARMKNLSTRHYPSLAVRPGFQTIATVPDGPVKWMCVYNNYRFVVVSNNKIREMGPYGGLSDVLYTASGAAFEWAFTHFTGQDNRPSLFISPGSAKLIRFAFSTYPFSVTEVSQAPDGLLYVTAYANRLFGVGGTYRSQLHFSALKKYDDWSTANDAGIIAVDTPSGAPIRAVTAGLDRLILMTETSIHELYGSGPPTFRLVTVSDKVGCVSNASCVVINGVLYWLGPNGIYRYKAGSSTPDKSFSYPVQRYIDEGWPGLGWAATTDGNRYYLVCELPEDVGFKTVLEYDPQFETWTVWKMDTEIASISSLDGAVYLGLQDGRILRMKTRGSDDGKDDTLPIQWLWESTPIGSGSYTTQKRWYDLWLVVDVPQGSSLDVYLSPKAEGDDDWVLVKSFTASEDMQSARIILPVEPIANANWVRMRLTGTGPVKVHELAYRERILPI